MPEPASRRPFRPVQVAGWLALAGVVLGPPLAHFHLVSAFVGFRLFLLGGIVALLTAVVALMLRVRGRPLGAGGTVAVGLAVLLVVLASRAVGVPLINDFTTDPADPPAFAHAATLPANVGRDLAYPPSFAAQQQACCADLKPLLMSRPPAEALAAARATAGDLGWTVTTTTGDTVEAVATSWLFGFADDVAVRVRPDGSGSRVDVRSKSRDGRGDQGANAARIRTFLSALQARVAAH